jgi:hypothetical protein
MPWSVLAYGLPSAQPALNPTPFHPTGLGLQSCTQTLTPKPFSPSPLLLVSPNTHKAVLSDANLPPYVRVQAEASIRFYALHSNVFFMWVLSDAPPRPRGSQ